MNNKLDDFAKLCHKKAKKCNIFDANCETVFTKYLHIKKKYNIYIYESISIYQYVIKNVNTEFYFAINKEDRVFILTSKVENLNPLLPNVYISKHQDPIAISNLLSKEAVIIAIENLNIRESDSVCLYKNGLIFNTFSNNFNYVAELLSDFMDNIPHKQSGEFNNISGISFSREFSPLIPYIEKWAISDDLLREEKINTITDEEKNDLSVDVYPYIAKINEYLLSFKDKPLSEEAILLGALAETVTEIKKHK